MASFAITRVSVKPSTISPSCAVRKALQTDSTKAIVDARNPGVGPAMSMRTGSGCWGVPMVRAGVDADADDAEDVEDAADVGDSGKGVDIDIAKRISGVS